jgi:hypothetical protein
MVQNGGFCSKAPQACVIKDRFCSVAQQERWQISVTRNRYRRRWMMGRGWRSQLRPAIEARRVAGISQKPARRLYSARGAGLFAPARRLIHHPDVNRHRCVGRQPSADLIRFRSSS